MKEKILQEFLNSKIKIKSIQKLNEYINFCIDNNKKEHTIYKIARHHILPNILFPKYSNLTTNDWNKSYLLNKDHYYAHYLLTESIDNNSMLFAFTSMHNQNIKDGIITEEDLISPEKIQLKMEERNKDISIRVKKEWLKGIKTNKKSVETKYKKIVLPNGKESTIHLESAKKAAYTMSIKQEDGLSIRERAAIKQKADYHKEIILSDGTKTTKSKEISKKVKERLAKKAKKFIIKNVFDDKYESNILLEKEVRKVSALLPKKTKNNYLGSKSNSRHILTNNGKSDLIGLYVIQV